MKRLLLSSLLLVMCAPLWAAEGHSMNEVRTYMPFTYPVDPAKIEIIPDMDMSYALAATLVEWDSEKQISAGLAESWSTPATNVYRFVLRHNASWSDGKPVTSAEVKESFEHAMRAHPDDLRSLIQILDRIECPSSREVDFRLKVPARESGLLGKLTEPNYGVLKMDGAGHFDLSVTTGPFYLAKESNQQQLTLVQNHLWHRFDPGASTPSRVVIRRSPPHMDAQTVLFADRWPNLIETSSLIKADLLTRYEAEHYELWKRPIDKFFYFQLGKRLVNPEGRALIRFLRQKLDVQQVVAGLSGYVVSNQIFPRGYQLHDLDFVPKAGAESLPEQFKHRALEVLISPARVSPELRENLRRAIKAAMGTEPRFISVPLEEITERKVRGDFDLYAGTMGLADPDPEGIMSFYLEGNTPLIPPTGNDFLARLDSARKEIGPEAKLARMRGILRDALNEGYLLPLFQLSTIGVGRGDLDFGSVSQSDESVTLSKIRFRKDPKGALLTQKESE